MTLLDISPVSLKIITDYLTIGITIIGNTLKKKNNVKIYTKMLPYRK